MDHHCPAVGTCIGLNNHRYFMIMLRWGSLSLWLYSGVSFLSYIFYKQNRNVFQVVTGFCLIIAAVTVSMFESQTRSKIKLVQLKKFMIIPNAMMLVKSKTLNK